jgi:uncharacterized protein with HEPN domain
MRDDSALLLDILEAARKVAHHIEDCSKEQFLTDVTKQSAVVRDISIMGEAANGISAAFRDAHPAIPWKRLIRLRQFYIHVYHRVDYQEVWRAATRLVPEVERATAPLLPSENDQ